MRMTGPASVRSWSLGLVSPDCRGVLFMSLDVWMAAAALRGPKLMVVSCPV